MEEPWSPNVDPALSLPGPRGRPEEQLLAALGGAFDAWSFRRIDGARPAPVGPFFRPAETIEYRGRLLIPSDAAYARIAPRFRSLGYVALLRRDGADDLVLAVPGALPTARGRYALAIGLFLATFLSVLWTGALSEQQPGQALNLLAGWPFAVSLLAILGAHEMGHFLMARRLGVATSPPFFIPLPLTLFGTMGAVMQMKAPPRDRRALLAVAVAGPLAGLVVALPVLVLGLSLSNIQVSPPTGVMQEGNSLIYAALKYAVFGRFLPSGGEDVFLHPVALAGWAGLLVTGLNLIPAGQLDGGHVAYVLFGERTRLLTWGIILALLAMGVLLWEGWFLWAGLVYVFGRSHATPLDEVTALRPWQSALAVGMLVLFVLVFTPVPMVIR